MNIPEKLYVARTFISGDEVRGYVIDATKDSTKAFQTKKSRVDGYCRKRPMPALTIDNVPTKGFAVVQKLDHYARETYFTIFHPEGFEFLVSAANMNDLIAHNDIHKGVFQDEMYFNDKLELINGKTKIFAKMQAKAEKEQNNKETVSNLKLGDGFKYNDKDFYYAGRVHAICCSKTKELCINDKSSQYHMIFSKNESAYILTNRLDKYELQPSAAQNVKTDLSTEIQKANAYFQQPMKHKYLSLSDGNVPVLIHNKAFKKANLKVQYNEMKPGSFYFSHNVLFKTTVNDKDYKVFFGIQTNNDRGGYSYYRSDYYIRYDSTEGYDLLGAYPCELDDNGQMQLDVDLNNHKEFSSWRGYSSPFWNPTKKYDSYRNNGDQKPLTFLPGNTKFYVGTFYL